MYNGYKGESNYRKNIINTLNRTKYENLKNVCSMLEYSFTPYDFIRLSNGYKNGDNELQKKIEYILDDCNYRGESSLLSEGKADELIKISKKEIEENLMSEVKDIFVKEYLENQDSCIPANSTLLDSFSLEELFFCVDKNIIQKRNCDGFAFELSDKEQNKIFDPSRNFYAECDDYEV